MVCLLEVLMRFIIGVSVAVPAVGAALAQSPGPQVNRGDAVRGAKIAMTWCAACHLVTAGETRPVVADVPTFPSIAKRLPTDVEVLAAFIANPHPPMPNLSLSRQDIADVLAYIASLK